MTTKRYRNGSDRYTIEFRWISKAGYYELYCLEHPYNPHSTDVNDCHLWPSNKICVSAGKEPKTFDRAVAVAHYWIHYYSKYVRTGSKEQPKHRVNV